MLRNKVCVFLPYFGQFNNYFQLFLDSVGRNMGSLDVLLLTDNKETYKYPDNVVLIDMTFEQIKEKITSYFDFDIELSKPYQLCTFRPAFGEIFSDLIKNYDFWGHIDCDLILGKIDDFINDGILDKYDKICSRGHFTLYRNDERINKLYKAPALDYRNVFSSECVNGFDEWGGISQYCEDAGINVWDELVMDDVIPGYECIHISKQISGKGSPYHLAQADRSKIYRKKKCIVYEYNRGELIRYSVARGKIDKERILYVHLQKRNLKVNNSLNERFLIAWDGFTDSEAEIDRKNIKTLSHEKSVNRMYIDLFNRKILKRLHGGLVWRIARSFRENLKSS